MEKVLFMLESIEELLQNQNILRKDVLSTEEAAKYIGISKQTLYQTMSKKQIPYYKPQGKLAVFNRKELDQWMMRNKQQSISEIETDVNRHKLKERRVK